jgi:Secretion system C-terminal sorting domain
LLINGLPSPQPNLADVVTISSIDGSPGTVRVSSNTTCGTSEFAEICFSPCHGDIGYLNITYSNPLHNEPLIAEVSGNPQVTEYYWYSDQILIEVTGSPYLSTHNWQCGDHQLSVVGRTSCGYTTGASGDYWGLCSGGYYFTIYPNPSGNQLTVSYSSPSQNEAAAEPGMKDFEIKLVNDKGRVIQQAKSMRESNSITIDTRNVSNGTYFLHITEGKETVKKQVIIQH